jgi:hypothetical protein
MRKLAVSDNVELGIRCRVGATSVHDADCSAQDSVQLLGNTLSDLNTRSQQVVDTVGSSRTLGYK